jgi:hypothetical protein
MKKYLMLIILVFSSTAWTQDQSSDEEYVYPYQSCTPEWAQFKSYKEKVDACQIPKEKLARMSTAALVKACLDYPMFGNICLYNTPQQGFDALAREFNGMQELLKRKDACRSLLTLYPKFDLEKQDAWPTKNKNYGPISHWYLETILAQKPILENADSSTRINLLKEVQKRYLQKKAKSKEYGPATQGFSTLLMVKVMDCNGNLEEEKKVNPRIKKYLETGVMGDTTMVEEIFKIAKRKTE